MKNVSLIEKPRISAKPFVSLLLPNFKDMPKIIKLTQGKVALVDNADFDWLNQWKWQSFTKKDLNTTYAKRGVKIDGKVVTIFMHRLILGLSSPRVLADHKDKNGLNNQRNNLRVANASDNAANKVSQKNSSSKYLGVHWNKGIKKWVVYLRKNGVSNYAGSFIKEIDAAAAYNMLAIKFHGDFANINKI